MLLPREILHAQLVKLKQLHEDTGVVPSSNNDICYNVFLLARDAGVDMEQYHTTPTIGHYAKEWPKYSGDEDYPVPSPCSHGWESALIYANACDNNFVWNVDHPYGKLRMELLDFLIDHTKD